MELERRSKFTPMLAIDAPPLQTLDLNLHLTIYSKIRFASRALSKRTADRPNTESLTTCLRDPS